MKFIYNPLENGSLIKKWVGSDNIERLHEVGKIYQYPDQIGQELMETYPFLQDLSPTEALKLKEELDNKKPFACKYCNFSSNAEIALKGHMRTHKAEIEKETIIDPMVIPLSEGKETKTITGSPLMQKPNTPFQSRQVIDETTGSEFYGPGFEEKRGI